MKGVFSSAYCGATAATASATQSSSLVYGGLVSRTTVTRHAGELDDVTRLGLGILSHLLVRTHVATLFKRLNDSKLGRSVIGGGYDGAARCARARSRAPAAPRLHAIASCCTHITPPQIAWRSTRSAWA